MAWLRAIVVVGLRPNDPLSRMYDWQLRFVHRSGVAETSYSFRAALPRSPKPMTTACIYCGTRLVAVPKSTWRLCPKCEPKLFKAKP
jgi:hypothetical protein